MVFYLGEYVLLSIVSSGKVFVRKRDNDLTRTQFTGAGGIAG